MTEITIGIDISKDRLDVCALPSREARQFDNTIVGMGELMAWIGDRPVARIVFEATGRYHRLLEITLGQTGLPLVKVNPKKARRFAEATGQLAKTDRVDAAMLARFGESLKPEPKPADSSELAELKELHAARQALMKDRTAAKNRLKTQSLAVLKQQAQARLTRIEADLAAVDAEIERRIGSDPDLKRKAQILGSIPGIGKLTVFTLLIEMPELGSMTAKQVASLAGLAPMTRQSGKWRGHAFIRGGRAQLRHALYMPALVACRFNEDLKAKYDQLIAAGKPAKLAITAIMRKLIVLANALIAKNRPWAKITA